MRKINYQLASMVAVMVVLFGSTITAAKTLPEFNIVAESWKPYQFKENNEVKGIAADLMVFLLKKVGSTQNRNDIKIVPWIRGYKTAQHVKNTILFSTTRTAKREDMFKWVGPIFRNTTLLIAKKGRHVKITSPHDLKKYKIGTLRGDVGEQYMEKLGISLKKLDRNTSNVANVKKLYSGRIDMVVESWGGFVNDAKDANIDSNLFEPVYDVDTKDIDYAFYKGTPDWIIQKFQNALNEYKKEGKLKALFKKYGKTK